jgi:hypothetical protein
MQKFIWLLLAVLAVPAFAAGKQPEYRLVTVEQLEQIIATAHGNSDRKVESQLSSLFLSQRLSAERLAQIEAELPGPASRRALMVICDEAEFLRLPARDLPQYAPPDKATQDSVLKLIVNYVNQTTHELPNFLATRETSHFETFLWRIPAIPQQAIAHRPLSFQETSNVTVFYRDGKEFQERGNGKIVKDNPSQSKMETNGEFSLILATVIGDAFRGKVFWDRWEQGPSGRVAVFRYYVDKKSSHFSVYSGKVQTFPAYHGVIWANPVDGSILRISVLAVPDPSDENVRADLLVEYGSVEIGNRNYICPLKSVAISVVRTLGKPTNTELSAYIGDSDPVYSIPFRMRINDTRFTNYHMFRAETRILTGDDAVTEGPSPAPSPEGVTAAEPAKMPKP